MNTKDSDKLLFWGYFSSFGKNNFRKYKVFFISFLDYDTSKILNGIGNTNGCLLSSTLFDVGKQLCKVFWIKCASTLRGITCWHSTWDDSCFLIDIQRKPIAGTPVNQGRDYLRHLEKPSRADKWRQLFQAIFLKFHPKLRISLKNRTILKCYNSKFAPMVSYVVQP